MKSKIYLIIPVLFALGLTIGWYIYTQHVKTTGEHNHSDYKNVNTFICPMHPQITSDKPSTCPICGMDLVPIEEFEEDRSTEHSEHKHETSSELAPVKITNAKQQLIGVKTEKAQVKKLFKSIRAPGRIAFDPELYTAQSEYLEALKQWSQVKDSPISDVRENTFQMIKSSKIRLKVLGLSDEQIAALTKKGRQSEGLLVSGKGQENWIYADVFEVDLPYISKDLSAQINANFLQGKSLPGKVVSVDQVINSETRTAKVRIKLLKMDQSIRPESYVSVTIFAPMGEHLSVPLEAILDTGKGTFVFVKTGEGQFNPKKINILFETDKEAAIGGGEISANEEVVVGGNFMLNSESRLRSVLMNNSDQSEHNHQ